MYIKSNGLKDKKSALEIFFFFCIFLSFGDVLIYIFELLCACVVFLLILLVIIC